MKLTKEVTLGRN